MLKLTHCGAGLAFSENKNGAKTPAILRVVDALTGKKRCATPWHLLMEITPFSSLL